MGLVPEHFASQVQCCTRWATEQVYYVRKRGVGLVKDAHDSWQATAVHRHENLSFVPVF